MKFFDLFRPRSEERSQGVSLALPNRWVDVIGCGYTPLSSNPEVMSIASTIAQLVGSMTIYLMQNGQNGDRRIVNELSKKIDINPNRYMTRSTFIQAIVMNMLLYGSGNAIVYPHTKKGLIDDLEPIQAGRVGFIQLSNGGYQVTIDNVAYDSNDILHFVYNPDPQYLWKGQGVTASLRGLVDNLSQAQQTKKAFMSSKWKPSIIIRVDSIFEEMKTKDGREKLIDSYLSSDSAGKPWIVPAEQFEIDQVKPLSLNDLAINDAVEIDKKTVASLFGVPSFVVGVGDFNQAEWNAFVNNKIRPIAQSIEQELTRKLIFKQDWYLRFNESKLLSYDIQTLSSVYGSLVERGCATGNEWRDKVGLEPKPELDKLMILENYIPVEDIGNQKKLIQGE